MLTEAEKKWLEERKQPNYPAACTRLRPIKKWGKVQVMTEKECRPICGYDYNWRDWECVLLLTKNDYKDAAEFEARVAAKLAQSPCWSCPEKSKLSCPRGKSEANGRPKAEACRLKHARLAVEEEMK